MCFLHLNNDTDLYHVINQIQNCAEKKLNQLSFSKQKEKSHESKDFLESVGLIFVLKLSL